MSRRNYQSQIRICQIRIGRIFEWKRSVAGVPLTQVQNQDLQSWFPSALFPLVVSSIAGLSPSLIPESIDTKCCGLQR